MKNELISEVRVIELDVDTAQFVLTLSHTLSPQIGVNKCDKMQWDRALENVSKSLDFFEHTFNDSKLKNILAPFIDEWNIIRSMLQEGISQPKELKAICVSVSFFYRSIISQLLSQHFNPTHILKLAYPAEYIDVWVNKVYGKNGVTFFKTSKTNTISVQYGNIGVIYFSETKDRFRNMSQINEPFTYEDYLKLYSNIRFIDNSNLDSKGGFDIFSKEVKDAVGILKEKVKMINGKSKCAYIEKIRYSNCE